MMEGSSLSPGGQGVPLRCMSPAGPSPNTRPEESFPPRLETPCVPTHRAPEPRGGHCCRSGGGGPQVPAPGHTSLAV